jgi:tRNA A37 threonylcarbamoyladenosine synthetase subunit TsaC/SUA5/YrdC
MTWSEIGAGEEGAVERAVRHLEAGGLLVHPTAGVYGIGGGSNSALDAEVARLKGRPPGPGVVHLVADVDTIRRTWPRAAWPSLADRLADDLWPGLLTLVLDDGTDYGVAVRVEPHPYTRSVLRRWGGALGSTSVNLSGGDPAADSDSAREVLAAFPDSWAPVLFVDAGRLPGPPPSTLVRVPGRDGDAYELLRAGAIAAAEIEAIARRPADDPGTARGAS